MLDEFQKAKLIVWVHDGGSWDVIAVMEAK